MKLLQHVATLSALAVSCLAFSADNKRLGIRDLTVFVKSDAKIEKAIFEGSAFEGLPCEVGIEVLEDVLGTPPGSTKTTVKWNKNALNCRLVKKDWSKLFVFYINAHEADFNVRAFWKVGKPLSFRHKDMQKKFEMLNEQKAILGHFWCSDKKQHSEQGMRLFLKAMISNEAPYLQGNATLLNEILSENTHVKILAPQGTRPSDQRSVGELVKKCKNVRELKMRDAHMGDEGAKGVASALKDHQKLEHIDWCNNNVTDSGAIDLAKALETNTSLKTLDLHNGKVGWEGAQAFAIFLKKNHTLKTLYLSGQDIKSWDWAGNDFPSVDNIRNKVQEKGTQKRMVMS